MEDVCSGCGLDLIEASKKKMQSKTPTPFAENAV
jgi:hypothetical protein